MRPLKPGDPGNIGGITLRGRLGEGGMGTVYFGATLDGGQVEAYLSAHDVPAGSIGPDGPRRHDGVHVGTLQRFKGLEYQRMILAGITDAAVPGYRAPADQARQQRELMRARSLLFVAATRARDALVISWNGQPSRFLPPVQ
jgi:superfamily I DNA/RNA helicase